MKEKKIIFTIEVDVGGDTEKQIIKNIRVVRTAIKAGVKIIKNVKITRIHNKEVLSWVTQV